MQIRNTVEEGTAKQTHFRKGDNSRRAAEMSEWEEVMVRVVVRVVMRMLVVRMVVRVVVRMVVRMVVRWW